MNKCSKCGKQHKRKGQRLCHTCHAENMRKWRAGRVYVPRATLAELLQNTAKTAQEASGAGADRQHVSGDKEPQ